MTQDTVLNSYVETLVNTVETLGISKPQLLKTLPIEQQDIERSGYRLPLDLMTLLWIRAVELTGKENLGLLVGRQLQLGAFNILNGLVLNSPTAKEAIVNSLKYQSLVSEGGRLELNRSPRGYLIEYTPYHQRLALTKYQVEGVLCSLISFARSILSPPLNPIEIQFSHATNQDLDSYEEFFTCPVKFESNKNAILFSELSLSRTIPHADKELLLFHQNLADKKLEAHSQGQGYASHALKIIENTQHWDQLSPAFVATKMNLSLRQLQRLLTREATNYQHILDQARKRRAANLLSDTNLSAGDIAEQLGYDNLSSFHRAFKRWHNTTPKLFRQNRSEINF